MHSSEKIQGISTETVIAMQSKRKEELLEFCRQLGITMNNLDILYYRQHLYVQKLSKT